MEKKFCDTCSRVYIKYLDLYGEHKLALSLLKNTLCSPNDEAIDHAVFVEISHVIDEFRSRMELLHVFFFCPTSSAKAKTDPLKAIELKRLAVLLGMDNWSQSLSIEGNQVLLGIGRHRPGSALSPPGFACRNTMSVAVAL